MKKFLVLIFAMFSKNLCGADWYYFNTTLSPGKQIILNEKNIGGNSGGSAEVCKENSNYICYVSKSFNFAIPKNKKNNSWTYKGYTYLVIRKERFGVFGFPVDSLHIRQSKNGKKIMDFLFSFKNGLISFHSVISGAPTFFSEQYCGFGSDVTCVEPQINVAPTGL